MLIKIKVLLLEREVKPKLEVQCFLYFAVLVTGLAPTDSFTIYGHFQHAAPPSQSQAPPPQQRPVQYASSDAAQARQSSSMHNISSQPTQPTTDIRVNQQYNPVSVNAAEIWILVERKEMLCPLKFLTSSVSPSQVVLVKLFVSI